MTAIAATADLRIDRAPASGVSLSSWIAVLASMIGAFMAILNIQITNASLLDIEGGIGTGVDNGAWISTSYLIGEIIVIPLTDYLSKVFSFRRYMLVNGVLFPLFSIACAHMKLMSVKPPAEIVKMTRVDTTRDRKPDRGIMTTSAIR